MHQQRTLTFAASAFLVTILSFIQAAYVAAQPFTIVQNVTGNNRSDIRGQAFLPSSLGSGTGSSTANTVYLQSFEVIYAAGADAPVLYIYSAVPSSTATLNDGSGGTLVGQSNGKSTNFPYTIYTFSNLPLNRTTTYYALFRQNVQLEFGGSASSAGPYAGGKMYFNNGTLTMANDFTALKFTAKLQNNVPPHAGDVAALNALYNATNGANWTNKWNLASDPYTWYGVNWVGGRVSRLDINNNNLRGQIPPEVGNLSEMKSFWLLGNALTGPIPSTITNLVQLEYINLNFNDLSGPVPAFLGSIPSLQNIALSGNQFTGGVPTELSGLPNLTGLLINDAGLTGDIPPALGNMTQLLYLNLGDNDFSSVPSQLGNLVNLRQLDLAYAPLGTFPDWIFNLTQLENLRLNGCSIEGPIPAAIGSLTNLAFLSLSINKIAGPLPIEFFSLSDLNTLFLDNNNITGPMPSEFGNLTELIQLFLQHNSLQGAIPASLGNLIKLDWLSLDNNKLSGALPSELGNLPVIQRMGLSNNNFTGQIPASFGNLTTLLFIDLSHNNLSGPIAAEVANLTTTNVALADNKYDFLSFEPLTAYLSSAGSVKTISPQADITVANDTLFVAPGSPLQLTISTPGTNNRYEWFRGNTSIRAASADPTLMIASFETSMAGAYVCKVSNTLVPGLTLQSQPIRVTFPFVFSNEFPTLTDIGTKSVKLTASSSRLGQAYYVVTSSGAPAPTVTHIIGGKDGNGQPAIKSSVFVVSFSPTVVTIGGLTPETPYNLYTALNDPFKVQTAGKMFSFTTAAGIKFPGGYPKVLNVTASQINVAVQTTKAGTCYYVILPAGSPAPSAAQVIAKQNASGTAAVGGTLSIAAATDLNIAFGPLDEETGYEIYIVAKDIDDIITPVAHIEAVTITGLDFAATRKDFKVYPNPTDGILFLERAESSEALVNILDLNGRKMYGDRVTARLVEIDTRNFSSGLYILEVINVSGTIRTLVVKR